MIIYHLYLNYRSVYVCTVSPILMGAYNLVESPLIRMLYQNTGVKLNLTQQIWEDIMYCIPARCPSTNEHATKSFILKGASISPNMYLSLSVQCKCSTHVSPSPSMLTCKKETRPTMVVLQGAEQLTKDSNSSLCRSCSIEQPKWRDTSFQTE